MTINLSTVKGARIEYNRAVVRHKSENKWLSVSKLCNIVDGKKDGPMSRYIGNKMENAHEEIRKSREIVQAGYQKVIATLPASVRNNWDKPMEIPGVAREMTGQEKLMVVALSGSRENIRILREDYGFSLSEIKAVQNSLTQEESEAVKQLWDVNNRLHIMAFHNERGQTGVGINPGARMMVPLSGDKVEGGYLHWARGNGEKPLPLTCESLSRQTNDVIHHMVFQPILRDAMKLIRYGSPLANAIKISGSNELQDSLFHVVLAETHQDFKNNGYVFDWRGNDHNLFFKRDLVREMNPKFGVKVQVTFQRSESRRIFFDKKSLYNCE